jgi:hypothetical protein
MTENILYFFQIFAYRENFKLVMSTKLPVETVQNFCGELCGNSGKPENRGWKPPENCGKPCGKCG